MKNVFVGLVPYLLVAVMALSSCDGKQPAAHEHTYSTEWMKDATHHWHAATCEHTDEVKDKAEHSYAAGSDVCSVCGYDRSGAQQGGQGQQPGDVLSGEFSVSATAKVRFTRGNLYWDGSAFGMEANQYDYRTWYDAENDSAVINGQACKTPFYGASYSDSDGNSTTGLFYWSKDLVKTYAKTYDSTSRTTTDTFALAGAIAGYDCLTYDEWSYLIGDSTVRNGKYGLATITGINGTAGVTGFVLLPDELTLPAGCSFTVGKGSGYSTNTYSVSDWQRMGQAGAVFLPASGGRHDATLDDVASYGYYWSASPNADYMGYAYYLYFNSGSMGTDYDSRDYGQAVRLVARVQN